MVRRGDQTTVVRGPVITTMIVVPVIPDLTLMPVIMTAALIVTAVPVVITYLMVVVIPVVVISVIMVPIIVLVVAAVPVMVIGRVTNPHSVAGLNRHCPVLCRERRRRLSRAADPQHEDTTEHCQNQILFFPRFHLKRLQYFNFEYRIPGNPWSPLRYRLNVH